ncbi:MAG: bifunctional 3-(3-hydroxy-phenyl)propionate/3-hydroxycinnamic acid hydroxylase [Alphaproteobacteria bacterium]|nr:MAG: bifunctional 3-(3-hydroxy-phenyl)propionate/3-hydroxycinnamic acid hydroxylase [Alphaproteobacteria bacterium]
MNAAEFDCEVAVVGCGPVGAIAANLFGQAGLRTLVIEREAAPYPLPRAVHIDHEMMRIFQSAGLAQAVLPLMREAHGHIHIGADGGVIRYLGSKGLPKRFGWANDYFFFQPELEAAMVEGLARFAHVALRRGAGLTALEQTPDSVTLTLADARAVTARYVVACDGANSFVRKALGIALDDMQFHEPWLVVDAEVDGPITFPDFSGVPAGAELSHLSVMLCDPQRPATLVPGRRNHRRWEFMLLPGERDDAMMQPAIVEALVAPYVRNARSRVIRAATYRFHGLVAERWQSERVFLAGDAAHQTPPFFGQGMCHGFRDVANLAWKLKAVLRGGADPRLLESYQPERAPHVRAVIEAAIGAGRYICERDPAAAAKRDAALRAAMGKPVVASASDLIPPLRAGVVDPSGAPGTGARFIQPYVAYRGRRTLLDDATGGGFVLLASSPGVLHGLSDAQRGSLDRLGVRVFAIDDASGVSAALSDDTGDLAAWFAAHDAAAVMLRPDFYVYGTARDAGTLASLIENLRAALAPTA